ncbi:hypothetical protein HPB49_024249 [Dermacentor silvarum]|uniref:Uncharacterized protein n=1 Tax=Dermacentor silvarum TaxID=543639 RepID=A0ACB8C619_DERSI|nr:hypothetical protein HPB49_024249 [Dermacentor silvarum]
MPINSQANNPPTSRPDTEHRQPSRGSQPPTSRRRLRSYTYTNPRGNLLHKVIEDMDLTLVNDPRSSTRLGTSVARDTTPDLSLTRNIPQACWTNLAQYLGSDHALLATTLHGLEYKARIGTARLTDWAKLREIREERATNEQSLQIQSIKDGITQLHQDVKAHTKILETSTTTPSIDACLLHMWEARRSPAEALEKAKIKSKAQEANRTTHTRG